ncbi:hypothetical protein D047_3636B, partial [Vibrio parahaemolyticus VPTS-2010_2]
FNRFVKNASFKEKNKFFTTMKKQKWRRRSF